MCFVCQVFKPGDTKKSLSVTLIHHEGYSVEKDFYVLLKNPVGRTELGEPNLARITIIDDDGNDLALYGECEITIIFLSPSLPFCLLLPFCFPCFFACCLKFVG